MSNVFVDATKLYRVSSMILRYRTTENFFSGFCLQPSRIRGEFYGVSFVFLVPLVVDASSPSQHQ
jgi:hypothetical protein